MDKLFILVLNFNGFENTIECVESLNKTNSVNGLDVKIVVIENGSSDNSLAEFKKHIPQTFIIETGDNLGFTGGNNFGMKYAIREGADYIMILNNDTRVDVDMVGNLYKSVRDDNKAAGVLPKIYFEKGYEYHKDKYDKNDLGKVIWYAGGKMDWANLIGKNIGVDEVDNGQYDNGRVVELATGCCFMIKAKVLKEVGMFDDKFFLYYEDADLTERIKKRGYDIIFEPSAIMWHKNAESTGKSGSPLQDYFIARNRMLFGMRYAPLRTKIALMRESFKLLRGGREWQKKGVRDYYLRRFGKGSFFKK